MAHYTVRSGDTLWTIAERCCGDGQLWSYLADNNPLAAAGVLYAGQRLETPPPPARQGSLADAHRHALPLAHAPVKITLDGGGPLFRHDGLGRFGLSGIIGELIFHRHGHVHLGELTVSSLLRYRLEQVAWAEQLFVEHFTAGLASCCGYSWRCTAPEVAQVPYHYRGPGYTITGRIGFWGVVHDHPGIVDNATYVRTAWMMNPSRLFQAATLVLEELPTPGDALAENSVPLGRVLRAACPHLLSPAALWALTRDESSFRQPPPMSSTPAPEEDWTATQATPPPSAPKRKKSARKIGEKKPRVKKRAPRQAKPRTSRQGKTD